MAGLKITTRAVVQQIMAMGDFPLGFDIACDSASAHTKIIHRTWQQNVICAEKTIGYLRHINATGHNIFVRPAAHKDENNPLYPAAFILQNLNISKIKLLEKKFLIKPAAVIETSAKTYQIWLILKTRPFYSRSQMLLISKRLHKFAGIDPLLPDSPNPFGLLAGFVNYSSGFKTSDDQNAFVKCTAADGHELWNSEQLLESIGESYLPRLENTSKSAQRIGKSHRKNITLPPKKANQAAANQFWLKNMIALKSKYQESFDISRAEWMTVLALLQKQFQPVDILYVMLTAEIPNIPSPAERKQTALAIYLETTIFKAIKQLAQEKVRVPQPCQQFHQILDQIARQQICNSPINPATD